MYRFFVLILFSFFFSGCTTRFPEPVSYPYSQQNKMQASYHWEVLARDLASRINNQLILSDNISTSVFVESTCGDEANSCEPNETSAFNEAFRDLLITDLVNLGVPTATTVGEDTIEVLYKVQVVRHDANRIRTLQPGVLTALSSAIVVLRNAPSELVLLASGVAADIANTSLTLSSQHEVIITTSMIQGGKYLFRSSDIYYINDRDFYHYQEKLSKPAKVQLRGPTPSPEDTQKL